MHGKLIPLALFFACFLGADSVQASGFSSAWDNETPRVKKKTLTQWTFRPQGSAQSYEVQPGKPLSDQLPKSTPCCTGILSAQIETELGPIPGEVPVGIYIPSIGGALRARLNGFHAPVSRNDHSSVGPILILNSEIRKSPSLRVDLMIEGPDTPFAGLWEAPPILGAVHDLGLIRDHDWFHDRAIPLLIALFLLGGAGLLVIAFITTQRRFSINLLVASGLFSGALFAFGISSTPRALSYFAGSATYYSFRILAVLGMYFFSLALSPRLKIFEKWGRKALCGIALLAAASFASGLFSAFALQRWLVFASALSLLLPSAARPAPKSGRRAWIFHLLPLFGAAVPVIFSSFLCATGLFRSPPVEENVIFLGFFATLALAAFHLFDAHVRFFDRWKFQFIRLKRIERSAIALASEEFSDSEMSVFATTLRRAMRVRRASIAKATPQGTYVVCGLSGLLDEAMGSTIDPSEHPHIARSLAEGEVTIADLPKKRGMMWHSTSCVSLPVPLTRNPSYLVLLSDPIASVAFDRQDIPYMNQLSKVLWSNLMMSRERRLRREAETRFRQLVETMDPNLHSRVTQTLNTGEQKYSVKGERGIVYFDQKDFSSLIEKLDEKKAEILGIQIAKWVSEVAMRHRGHIKGFYGDAYLLECVKLGDESAKGTAERTAQLLWELAESVPELNKRLIEAGVGAVKFRFGGHFGEATDLSLFVVEKTYNTLFGDNVNVAQRLQSVANPGEVFISSDLAKLLFDRFALKPVPRSFVKGRRGFVEVFKIIGILEPAREKAS